MENIKDAAEQAKQVAQDEIDQAQTAGARLKSQGQRVWQQAQSRGREAWDRVQGQSSEAFENSLSWVQDNPGQAIGYAFGAGVLIGLLLTAGRSSSKE